MSDVSGEPVGSTRRGTILIVDDDEGVRFSLRAILDDTCEVLEAADGGRALEILRDRRIDVVTLDQQMPGEPGIDVLARIKALDPSVAVVVITGVRDAQTAIEAIRLGALDYVVKPFDVDIILRLVRSAFETRALHRHGAADQRPTDR